MDGPKMAAFAEEMVADLERQIEQSEEIIKLQHGRIERLRQARAHVIDLYSGTAPLTQQVGRINRRGASLEGCPISWDEMKKLGDRHLIVGTIAGRDPQSRVHVPSAARWLHHAGIVATVPSSLTKTLVRAMRRQPTIWIDEGRGWFRLIIPQQEQYSSYTHAEPDSFERQENSGDVGDKGPHAEL